MHLQVDKVISRIIDFEMFNILSPKHSMIVQVLELIYISANDISDFIRFILIRIKLVDVLTYGSDISQH